MAYSTIRKGTSNDDVKTWQNFLKSQNYNIATDGIFGNETDNATRDWQTKNGLTADGIVGANTWASMNTGNNTNSTTTNTNDSNIKTVNGVDQETMNKGYNSTFTQSDATTESETKKNDALSNYENYVSNTEIVDPSVYDTLGKEFVVPEAVTQADAWLSSQLSQIQSGKTSYTDQINGLMDKIMNREKFEYDVDNDQLFQQALASAMNSGKSAMQDTIGQASALTGGYGSTYATSAGNQAYNQFIEDAYNNLPEYYQMAMEAYQMEGQEMYNQLNMLNTADDKEWNKLITGYDATYQHRNQMYNEAYTAFRDTKTDALNTANLQLSEHEVVSNNLFNVYSAYSNEYENQYAKDYQNWSDGVTMAQQYANLLNTDYWNQTNFDESVRQFDKEFNANYVSDGNGGYVKKSNTTNSKTVTITDENGKNIEVNVDDIPKAVSTQASKFKTDEERENYLNSQVDAGLITESEADYLYSVYKSPSSDSNLPEDIRTWSSDNWKNATFTKVKNTINWWGGDDNDDVIVNGSVHSINDVRTMMKNAGVSEKDRNTIYNKLKDLDTDATYSFISKK